MVNYSTTLVATIAVTSSPPVTLHLPNRHFENGLEGFRNFIPPPPYAPWLLFSSPVESKRLRCSVSIPRPHLQVLSYTLSSLIFILFRKKFTSNMASSLSEPSLKSETGGGGEASEAAVTANEQLLLYRGLKKAKKERGCTAKERTSKMPPCAAGKRSSIYRGVTRYDEHL